MATDPVRAPSGGRLSPEAAAAYVGTLFECHGRMVYAICRLLLRDRVEAEDAAQQTFLSAHRSILGGTDPREPAAWLGTIARNECRARIRAKMAEPLVAVTDSDAASADLEHIAARRAEFEALCAALAELPRQQRDAVVLREFYGLTYEEVGAALGVTEAAVDSLLVRARRCLQAELRPARVASGVLVVPLALKDSLAQALPGFVSGAGASGAVAKVVSLPLAAKLAGVAATVAVVGTVGTVGFRGADIPNPEPEAAAAPAQVRTKSRAAHPLPVEFELKGRSGPFVLSPADSDDDERDEDEDEPEAEEAERGDEEDNDREDEPETAERDEPEETDEPEGSDGPGEEEADD